MVRSCDSASGRCLRLCCERDCGSKLWSVTDEASTWSCGLRRFFIVDFGGNSRECLGSLRVGTIGVRVIAERVSNTFIGKTSWLDLVKKSGTNWRQSAFIGKIASLDPLFSQLRGRDWLSLWYHTGASDRFGIWLGEICSLKRA